MNQSSRRLNQLFTVIASCCVKDSHEVQITVFILCTHNYRTQNSVPVHHIGNLCASLASHHNKDFGSWERGIKLAKFQIPQQASCLIRYHIICSYFPWLFVMVTTLGGNCHAYSSINNGCLLDSKALVGMGQTVFKVSFMKLSQQENMLRGKGF